MTKLTEPRSTYQYSTARTFRNISRTKREDSNTLSTLGIFNICNASTLLMQHRVRGPSIQEFTDLRIQSLSKKVGIHSHILKVAIQPVLGTWEETGEPHMNTRRTCESPHRKQAKRKINPEWPPGMLPATPMCDRCTVIYFCLTTPIIHLQIKNDVHYKCCHYFKWKFWTPRPSNL